MRRPAKRSHIGNPLERDIQAQVLAMLELHPRVALVWRQNTGAVKIDNKRFVRFGFPGVSDIIGFTVDGRFIAFEVKRKGENPTVRQAHFLAMCRYHGCIAERRISDVLQSVPEGRGEEAMTNEELEVVLAHLHDLIGDLPRYDVGICGGRYPEIEYEKVMGGDIVESADVDKLISALRQAVTEALEIRK